MKLIGSKALRFNFPHVKRQFGSDYDLVASEQELDKWRTQNSPNIKYLSSLSPDKYLIKLGGNRNYEIKIARPNTSDELILNNPGVGTYQEFEVSAPDVLLAVKKSHVNRNINWTKHISDYHFLKSEGVIPHQQIYQTRLTEIRAKYNIDKGLQSNVPNQKFFTKSVKRIIDHDLIHNAVKYFEAPLFFKCKHDLSKAPIDENLFVALDHDFKIKLVREECFVLAIERKFKEKTRQFLINKMYESSSPQNEVSIPNNVLQEAYHYALTRICTDLDMNPVTIREFATENYPELKNMDLNYWEIFMKNMNCGDIFIDLKSMPDISIFKDLT